jgi:hypothetical protein
MSYKDPIRAAFTDQVVKMTNNDSFMEGKRYDKFDAVIAMLPMQSQDDLEMSEEFYSHYLIAPVTYVVYDKQEHDIEDFVKEKFGKHIRFFSSEDKEAGAQAIVDCFNLAKGRYDELVETEVKPAFNKFDKDGSGAIDREELGQLSKELGTELTEDQLTEALRDLDLNNDGVVDIDEFCRWYFTGMKPYNGGRRTLL